MSTFFVRTALAVALGATALSFATINAEAKTNFMQECSAKYKAAKSAGTIDAGTKWTDFMKTNCSTGADQAATTGTPAVTPDQSSAPVKLKNSKKVTAASTASAAPSGGMTHMQQCSADWKAMKDANSVPSGMGWRDFLKGGCVNTASGDSAVPAEPKTQADLNAIDVSTKDKNGKPFTPGQIAAHKRIKECATEWHADKDAGSLPAGEKWPQFWSACNTRLKAQG